MNKIRSIVFIAVFCVISCSALCNLALSAAVPSVFSIESFYANETSNKGALKKVIADPASLLTDPEVASKLGDVVEDGAGRCVPFRDQLLLTCGALQRQGIVTANAVAGFSCYPTFFGSEVAYTPSKNTLTYIPTEASKKDLKELRQFVQGAAKKAAEHPDKNFVIYMVQGKNSPAASPCYDLMNHALTPEMLVSLMEEEMAEAGVPDNLVFLTDSYASFDSYCEEFFTTDHHWNIIGATRAYNTIGEHLGWEPMSAAPLFDIEGYRFSGTAARAGLMPLSEPVFDVERSYAPIEITSCTGETVSADDHSAFEELSTEAKKYGFYYNYYNTKDQTALFSNPSAEGTCLLVSDSYGAVIARLMATQYGTVNRSNDLFTEVRNRSFEETLAQDDYDTVVMLAQATAMSGLTHRSPRYFD